MIAESEAIHDRRIFGEDNAGGWCLEGGVVLFGQVNVIGIRSCRR